MEPETHEKPATEQDCPICQEHIATPKTTSCQHTFCQECLDKWLRDHTTCPMCHVTICEIPNSNAASHNKYNLIFTQELKELAEYINLSRVMNGMDRLMYSS